MSVTAGAAVAVAAIVAAADAVVPGLATAAAADGVRLRLCCAGDAQSARQWWQKQMTVILRHQEAYCIKLLVDKCMHERTLTHAYHTTLSTLHTDR
jgi:hypothetical protein